MFEGDVIYDMSIHTIHEPVYYSAGYPAPPPMENRPLALPSFHFATRSPRVILIIAPHTLIRSPKQWRSEAS